MKITWEVPVSVFWSPPPKFTHSSINIGYWRTSIPQHLENNTLRPQPLAYLKHLTEKYFIWHIKVHAAIWNISACLSCRHINIFDHCSKKTNKYFTYIYRHDCLFCVATVYEKYRICITCRQISRYLANGRLYFMSQYIQKWECHLDSYRVWVWFGGRSGSWMILLK